MEYLFVSSTMTEIPQIGTFTFSCTVHVEESWLNLRKVQPSGFFSEMKVIIAHSSPNRHCSVTGLELNVCSVSLFANMVTYDDASEVSVSIVSKSTA